MSRFVDSARMSSDPPSATYTYAQLAARIGQVLGETPSLSSLRAAAAAQRRASPGAATRVTAGMPTPLPKTGRTQPAAFDVEQIEAWLKHHPRRARTAAEDELATALASGADRRSAVEAARRNGLSWRRITEVLNRQDGTGRTVSGVHKAYRHLDPAPSSSGHL
jgi:hypothetical protein